MKGNEAKLKGYARAPVCWAKPHRHKNKRIAARQMRRALDRALALTGKEI